MELLAGRYRLGRTIGVGGMGRVIEAVHVELARPVAIKMIEGPDADPARFKREAIAVARIDHPNVVRVYDFCEPDDGPAFLVMELLEGRSLATAIRAEAPMPAPRAIEIAISILDALAAAHAGGVIHRDVKPANVFLVAHKGRERVKVVDFGIARVEAPGPKTATGTILGTPAFMAPEQWLSNVVDERADVFATGVVLYQMLSGRLPFSSKPEERIQDLAPTPIAGVGSGLWSIVARALAFDPGKRWPSATAMRDALAALDAPRPRPWRAGVAAAVATLVVGGGIATVAIARRSEPAKPSPIDAAVAQAPPPIEADAATITEVPSSVPAPMPSASAVALRANDDRYTPHPMFLNLNPNGASGDRDDLMSPAIQGCFRPLRLPNTRACGPWTFAFLIQVDTQGGGTARMGRAGVCPASIDLYREPQIAAFERCMVRALGQAHYWTTTNVVYHEVTISYEARK